MEGGGGNKPFCYYHFTFPRVFCLSTVPNSSFSVFYVSNPFVTKGLKLSGESWKGDIYNMNKKSLKHPSLLPSYTSPRRPDPPVPPVPPVHL